MVQLCKLRTTNPRPFGAPTAARQRTHLKLVFILLTDKILLDRTARRNVAANGVSLPSLIAVKAAAGPLVGILGNRAFLGRHPRTTLWKVRHPGQ